jgi:hypothetical protein
MKLFDFIKIMFSDKGEYEKLSYYDRSKNRFMVTRFMSISYPEVANLLNRNGLNPTYVNDSFRMITRRFKRTPKWIFTKTKTVKKVDDEFKPKDSTIEFYLKKNESTMRDYNEVLKSARKDLMLSELKELEKILDDNGYAE